MKKKTFDCVKMKNEIQQELLHEMRALSPDEWNETTAKVILSNSILSSVWEQAMKIDTDRNIETVDKYVFQQEAKV